MKKLVIYGHGGSQNHGNEAIVRGVQKLFPDSSITLYSSSPEVDVKFGLDKICTIKRGYTPTKIGTFKNYLVESVEKYFNYGDLRFRFAFEQMFKDFDKDTIYMLEAGDQYCEKGNHRACYGYLNKTLRKMGAKTIMLGCSINPEIVEQKEVIEDLNRYSAIIARESLTYNALKKSGIIENTYLAPCPAFAMESKPCKLHSMFDDSEVVGFNLGFLAQGNEEFMDNLFENCANAIDYVLKETKYKVALVPHVNWECRLSDFVILDKLYERFKDTNRIFVLEEKSAPEQKYVISRLKFFVALRTHAAVPAIEQCIPTIITGYKNKSTGIHNDIFTGEISTLAHLQSLKTPFNVKEKLEWMIKNEKEIIDYMKNRIPDYLKGLETIKKVISEI